MQSPVPVPVKYNGGGYIHEIIYKKRRANDSSLINADYDDDDDEAEPFNLEKVIEQINNIKEDTEAFNIKKVNKTMEKAKAEAEAKYSKVKFAKLYHRVMIELKYKKNDTCALCLEDMKNKKVQHTPCGHTFHMNCLEMQFSKYYNYRCSLCRYQIYDPEEEPEPEYTPFRNAFISMDNSLTILAEVAEAEWNINNSFEPEEAAQHIEAGDFPHTEAHDVEALALPEAPHIEAPQQHIEAPQQHIEAPQQHIEAPQQHIEAHDIEAHDIEAHDIEAPHIEAGDFPRTEALALPEEVNSLPDNIIISIAFMVYQYTHRYDIIQAADALALHAEVDALALQAELHAEVDALALQAEVYAEALRIQALARRTEALLRRTEALSEALESLSLSEGLSAPTVQVALPEAEWNVPRTEGQVAPRTRMRELRRAIIEVLRNI